MSLMCNTRKPENAFGKRGKLIGIWMISNHKGSIKVEYIEPPTPNSNISKMIVLNIFKKSRRETLPAIVQTLQSGELSFLLSLLICNRFHIDDSVPDRYNRSSALFQPAGA